MFWLIRVRISLFKFPEVGNSWVPGFLLKNQVLYFNEGIAVFGFAWVLGGLVRTSRLIKLCRCAEENFGRVLNNVLANVVNLVARVAKVAKGGPGIPEDLPEDSLYISNLSPSLFSIP